MVMFVVVIRVVNAALFATGVTASVSTTGASLLGAVPHMVRAICRFRAVV